MVVIDIVRLFSCLCFYGEVDIVSRLQIGIFIVNVIILISIVVVGDRLLIVIGCEGGECWVVDG